MVKAALVAGEELDDDEAAEDAMPAWMDGDADSAAESMVAATTTLTLLYGL